MFYIYLSIKLSVCTHVCVCFIHVCISRFMLMVYIYACIYIYTRIYIHIYMCVCMCMLVYIYLYVYTYVYMYICMPSVSLLMSKECHFSLLDMVHLQCSSCWGPWTSNQPLSPVGAKTSSASHQGILFSPSCDTLKVSFQVKQTIIIFFKKNLMQTTI